MQVNWVCKSFSDLTPNELYAVLQLRNEVFVVEQTCPYQDADNKDAGAFHFMGWSDNTLIAYTRLLPAGLTFENASIGRVVTSPAARGAGIGRELMEQSIKQACTLFGAVPIEIGAQLYLKKFYESLGFIQTSEMYLEDGIEHIEMILETPIS
jgi:ElaA protein